MNKRIAVTIILSIILISSTAAAQDTFSKWMDYLEETYYRTMMSNISVDTPLSANTDPGPVARMMGYDLSLQLKFVRRGSPEHKIWLKLEENSRKYLVKTCRELARRLSFSSYDAEKLEKRALREFAGATIGLFDKRMAALTFIHQENVPNFFEKLKGNTGQQQVDSGNTEQGNIGQGNATNTDGQNEPESVNTGQEGEINTQEQNNPDNGNRTANLPRDYILGTWHFSRNTGEHYTGEAELAIIIEHSHDGNPKEYDATTVAAGSWQQERKGLGVGKYYGRFQYYSTRNTGDVLFYLFTVNQKKSAEQGRIVYNEGHSNVILKPAENRLSIGRGRSYSRWYR